MRHAPPLCKTTRAGPSMQAAAGSRPGRKASTLLRAARPAADGMPRPSCCPCENNVQQDRPVQAPLCPGSRYVDTCLTGVRERNLMHPCGLGKRSDTCVRALVANMEQTR